jgi:hypothetical protein
MYLDVEEKIQVLEELRTPKDLDRGYAKDLYNMTY